MCNDELILDCFTRLLLLILISGTLLSDGESRPSNLVTWSQPPCREKPPATGQPQGDFFVHKRPNNIWWDYLHTNQIPPNGDVAINLENRSKFDQIETLVMKNCTKNWPCLSHEPGMTSSNGHTAATTSDPAAAAAKHKKNKLSLSALKSPFKFLGKTYCKG